MWAYVISGVAYVLTFILGLYFKIAIKINLRGDDDMCTGIHFEPAMEMLFWKNDGLRLPFEWLSCSSTSRILL